MKCCINSHMMFIPFILVLMSIEYAYWKDLVDLDKSEKKVSYFWFTVFFFLWVAKITFYNMKAVLFRRNSMAGCLSLSPSSFEYNFCCSLKVFLIALMYIFKLWQTICYFKHENSSALEVTTKKLNWLVYCFNTKILAPG